MGRSPQTRHDADCQCHWYSKGCGGLRSSTDSEIVVRHLVLIGTGGKEAQVTCGTILKGDWCSMNTVAGGNWKHGRHAGEVGIDPGVLVGAISHFSVPSAQQPCLYISR